MGMLNTKALVSLYKDSIVSVRVSNIVVAVAVCVFSFFTIFASAYAWDKIEENSIASFLSGDIAVDNGFAQVSYEQDYSYDSEIVLEDTSCESEEEFELQEFCSINSSVPVGRPNQKIVVIHSKHTINSNNNIFVVMRKSIMLQV